MARWIGLVPDATAGGTTATAFVSFTTPTEFIPVTTATVDQNLSNLDRNDEARGNRGNAAVKAFASDPRLTFSCRAYPGHATKMLRAALSGTVTPTGTAPASVQSVFAPKQVDPLNCLQGMVIREGQRDQLCGLWVSEVTFNFPVDEEGSMDVELWGLYHKVDATPGSGLPTPSYASDVDTFKLRDITVYDIDGTHVVTNVSACSLTFNNGLIDDFASRYSAGQNVAIITTGSPSVDYRLWYPSRQKIGPQVVTGSMDFGSVDAARDLRKLISASEKVVIEATAGPLGTTPPAKETLRFTLYNLHWTGGDGAGPLVREGDIRSSYDFTAYLDTTGKDIDVTYIGTAALSP